MESTAPLDGGGKTVGVGKKTNDTRSLVVHRVAVYFDVQGTFRKDHVHDTIHKQAILIHSAHVDAKYDIKRNQW